VREGWGIDQRSPVPSFVWQSLNHYTEGVYMEQNRLVVIYSYSSFNLLIFDIQGLLKKKVLKILKIFKFF
jgi:hypothetical protein